MKERTVAKLTLKDDPKEWTAQGRTDVANWLRRCADTVEEQPEPMAEGFQFRYCVPLENGYESKQKEPAAADQRRLERSRQERAPAG